MLPDEQTTFPSHDPRISQDFPLQKDFHLETNLLISLFPSILLLSHPSSSASFLLFLIPLIHNPSLFSSIGTWRLFLYSGFFSSHNPKHFRKKQLKSGIKFSVACGGRQISHSRLLFISHCFLHKAAFVLIRIKIKWRHLEVRGVIHTKKVLLGLSRAAFSKRRC